MLTYDHHKIGLEMHIGRNLISFFLLKMCIFHLNFFYTSNACMFSVPVYKRTWGE